MIKKENSLKNQSSKKLQHQTMDFVPNKISNSKIVLGEDDFYDEKPTVSNKCDDEELEYVDGVTKCDAYDKILDLEQDKLAEEFMMKKSKKNEKRSPKKAIVSRIMSFLIIVISGVFVVKLAFARILPTKYYWMIISGIVIFNLITIFLALFKRTFKVISIVWNILSLFVICGLIFATVKMSEAFEFLDKNFTTNSSQYSIYNILVNKNAKYQRLSDLKNKELMVYDEPNQETTRDEISEKIKEKIGETKIAYSDKLDETMKRIVEKSDEIILVNAGTYGAYLNANEKYENSVRILGTIKIKINKKQIEASNNKLNKNAFLVYFSGIDTRTDSMPYRSLSDVNILMAVNPKTKKILLVSTPRDSYVMIHGTTGLKDKLTHAGSRGGVELSQKTIEDLYGLKVNRYMRVNFNFVMKLVDAIGGITINSDVDFVVKTAHHGCTFSPGMNSVDGRCALGFTRERYAYADGDRHRGRNQIHVIEQIFKKLTSGSTVLRNYSQILQSLDGTFDTNISSEDILSLIRMQLDDMSKWQIESFNVDGSGAMRRTNSYPNQDLYVMDIDMSTLQTAKEKIQNIINN